MRAEGGMDRAEASWAKALHVGAVSLYAGAYRKAKTNEEDGYACVVHGHWSCRMKEDQRTLGSGLAGLAVEAWSWARRLGCKRT